MLLGTAGEVGPGRFLELGRLQVWTLGLSLQTHIYNQPGAGAGCVLGPRGGEQRGSRRAKPTSWRHDLGLHLSEPQFSHL